jgi:hypothetical protein
MRTLSFFAVLTFAACAGDDTADKTAADTDTDTDTDTDSDTDTDTDTDTDSDTDTDTDSDTDTDTDTDTHTGTVGGHTGTVGHTGTTTSSGDSGGSGIPEAICDDTLDDDSDGLTDCEDLDCAADPACAVVCPEFTLPAISPTLVDDTTGLANNSAGSCGGRSAPDATVEFTAPIAGDYVFTTNGSTFDTILYALDGCGGAELDCDDDDGIGVQSQIVLNLAAGQTIALVVDGFSSASFGPFTLEAALVQATEVTCDDLFDNDADGDVDCFDSDCAAFSCVEICGDGFDNDADYDTDCADAACAAEPECLEVCDDGLDNDFDFDTDCRDADCSGDPTCAFTCPNNTWTAGVPGADAGDNTGRPDSFSEPCGYSSAGEETWEFTAPSAATYTFDTIGTTYDTILYVVDSCDPFTATSLGCDDDIGGGVLQSELSVVLAAGQTVYVVVTGYGTNAGAYTLNVR